MLPYIGLHDEAIALLEKNTATISPAFLFAATSPTALLAGHLDDYKDLLANVTRKVETLRGEDPKSILTDYQRLVDRTPIMSPCATPRLRLYQHQERRRAYALWFIGHFIAAFVEGAANQDPQDRDGRISVFEACQQAAAANRCTIRIRAT